jgi:hypothetical protein
MHNPYLLLADGLLAAYIAFDLRRVLTSGRARIWLGGTVTREHQPRPYWRYVYQGYAMLVCCFTVFLALIVWPDFFR